MLADHQEEDLVEIEVDLVEVEIEADLVEEVVAGVALEIEVEVEEDLVEEVIVDVEEVEEGDVVEEVDEVVVEEGEGEEEEDLSSRKVALTSPESTRLCRSLWRACPREPRFLSLSSISPQWGQSKGIKNPRNQEFGFTRTRKLKWYKQFHLFCIF